jgi:hypothetical protein
MRVSYGEVIQGREYIAQLIIEKKRQSKFTVIDVGGTATGWSTNIADCFVDINENNVKHQFVFDICKESNWQNILNYVQKFGKFDYCICTHTLEDIYNPYVVLDNLPRIAKSGIISMPSIHTEINFVESVHWSGFLHHRYLFGHKNQSIMIAPKLPVIEKLKNKKVLNLVEEIRYEWQNEIHYTVFMNNYLGPNTDTVLRNLEQFIAEQQNGYN